MLIKLENVLRAYLPAHKISSEEQTMNSRQVELPPMYNAAIGITDVGAVLEKLAMAVSYNSKTFVQLVEAN